MGMGENCSEERKEASRQPDEEGDEFLDKRHGQRESIMLCAGERLPCVLLLL